MKAVILCGGRGTRLRDLSEVLPKPMVQIGNRPIIWHIMKLYAHHGVSDFVLCLGYKGDVFREYFLHYETMNNDFTVTLGKGNRVELHGSTHGEDGWRVTLAETGEDAMTGARIRRASRYCGDETFCVTYGDGVSDVNIREVLAYHKAHGRLATLTGVPPAGRFGELKTEDDRVVAFTEKPQGQSFVNGGFFVFEPRFLEYLSADDGCVLEREPLERCAADDQLRVYRHRGYWQCMDTYRDWKLLEDSWQSGAAPWKVWK
jgi:glucose-1-phosphate cytidylyltransferase